MTAPLNASDLALKLASFLPVTVTRQLLQNSLPKPGIPRSLRAATIFADISGFTAMSEELATDGPRGAEELNNVLLLTFTAMIDLIHSYGGAISHFYGDAMSVYFPDGDGLAAQRALACGQMMQQLMASRLSRVVTSRPSGKRPFFELTIKIGVGYGYCQEVVVGSETIGLEHVLTGTAVDEAAQAEHYATAGQVVASQNVLAQAGLSHLNPKNAPFVVLETAVPIPKTSHILRWETYPLASINQLVQRAASFVNTAIIDRLAASTQLLQELAEHRPVTSLFVQFALEGDDDPSSTIATRKMGKMLQAYYEWACSLVNRFGRENAQINRVLTGDKGNQLHIIFGAPIAPDAPEQALRLALAMQAEKPSYIHHQKIGLAAGKVFAGPVGSVSRREYTVVGDVVNLSARLMQVAEPGAVLTDEATAKRAAHVILFDVLPAVRLKGKEEPVVLHRAVAEKRESARLQAYVGLRERPLVGRDAELLLLKEALAEALAGKGGAAALFGETGSGKTRLLVEGMHNWLAQGGQGLVGICHQHTTESPYAPWRVIWEDFFGLRREMDGAERGALVVEKTRQLLPNCGDDVYLWGEVLGLPLELPLSLAATAAEVRQNRFFSLVRRLFLAAARQQPLMLVLENAHWADTASLALLDEIGLHLQEGPLFTAVTFRTTGEPLNLALLEQSCCVPIVVADLSPQYGRDLLAALIGVQELPPPVEQQLGLRDREGRDSPVNPLFLEEAIRVMREAGVLRVNGRVSVDEARLSQIQLPDTIHGLLLARLDRLNATSRNVLQVASVIGRQFWLEPLSSLVTGLHTEKIVRVLADLSEEEITRLLEAAPEWVYLFQHALIQEVTYESMPYARRRHFHSAMADWLVSRYGDNLKPYYATLAYHYSRAGIHEEGLHYALAAARDAQAIFANREAVRLFTLAEQHLQALGEAQFWETAVELYLERGTVHRLVGDFDNAYADASHALRLAQAHNDNERLPQLFNLMADIRNRQSRYAEVRQLAENVLITLKDVAPPLEMARAHMLWGWAAISQLEYDAGLEHLRQAEQICRQIDNQQLLGKVLEAIGFGYFAQKQLEPALVTMQQAAGLLRRFSLPVNVGVSLNNIAYIQFVLGQPEDALVSFNEAVVIGRETSHNLLAFALVNRSGVQAYLGQYADALAGLEEAQQLLDRMNDEYVQVELHLVWGYEYCLAKRQWVEAGRHFEQAEQLIERHPENYPEEKARLLIGRGELALAAGSVKDAISLLETAVQLIEEKDLEWWQPAVHYHLGRAYMRAGKLDTARAYLEKGEALVDSGGCPDYLPLIYLTLAELVDEDDPQRFTYLEQSVRTAYTRARYHDKIRCWQQAGMGLKDAPTAIYRQLGMQVTAWLEQYQLAAE
ncbi:MAG: adenylate/guanylate cyclase domain-containing protein [Candidatus Promineifilaceae bacterium]